MCGAASITERRLATHLENHSIWQATGTSRADAALAKRLREVAEEEVLDDLIDAVRLTERDVLLVQPNSVCKAA